MVCALKSATSRIRDVLSNPPTEKNPLNILANERKKNKIMRITEKYKQLIINN